MRTEDIPEAEVSIWVAEPDPALLAAVGKLGEEAAELAARCCRSVIQGVHESDPGDGRTNLEHICDEIADVLALVSLLGEVTTIGHLAIHQRRMRKQEFKRPWLEALSAQRTSAG